MQQRKRKPKSIHIIYPHELYFFYNKVATITNASCSNCTNLKQVEI